MVLFFPRVVSFWNALPVGVLGADPVQAFKNERAGLIPGWD